MDLRRPDRGAASEVNLELQEWNVWWKRRGNDGIRRLLMTEWDPIGVRDIPEAAGEYDSYAPPIARMLRETHARVVSLSPIRSVETRWYANEMARGD